MKDAAEVVSKSLGVPIKAFPIGIGQGYEDVYFDWARLNEIQENGCTVSWSDQTILLRGDD
jgi:2,4-dichlorophenol 6-monooxygenase